MKTISLSLGGLVVDNKILLIKRVKPPFVGMWALPGGKLEFGEHVDECAVREIEEETGIKTECEALKGVVSEIVHEDDKEMHFMMFVCRLQHKGSIELKESNEGELRWFDIDKIKEHKNIIVSSDIEMIHKIILPENPETNKAKSVMRKKGDTYILEHFGD